MAGTISLAGSLSLDQLGTELTTIENQGFQQVTGLAVDTTQPRNLLTTISQSNILGTLTVVAHGDPCGGNKILSPRIYIQGSQMDVDVYRA